MTQHNLSFSELFLRIFDFFEVDQLEVAPPLSLVTEKLVDVSILT